MANINLPDPALIRQLFDYDPLTGILKWRSSFGGSSATNKVAGCISSDMRFRIGIKGRRYLSSRICWCWMTGAWPRSYIDHIDGNPSNDSWSNLREATHQQNLWNSKISKRNTSGFKGVYRDGRRWRAMILTDGRLKHLGSFPSPESANAAYCEEAGRLRGIFVRAT